LFSQIEDCQVVSVKTEEKHGFCAVQLGAGDPKPKRVSRAMKGHFEKHEVPYKQYLGEFRVSPEAMIPQGA
jgi:large subunit ribosomal protein L3